MNANWQYLVNGCRINDFDDSLELRHWSGATARIFRAGWKNLRPKHFATRYPRTNKKMRRWLTEIASVPKGQQTLAAIDHSGHKLLIFHSDDSIISSGKASAPLSANLTNGRGESVDIYFNFDIPDDGSHKVLDTRGSPIEYTAIQNLYHELAHAMHMMNGTWHYARSESQAIEEENIFRFQLARIKNRPYLERVYVNGIPICPEFPDRINVYWQQDIICL